MNHARRNLPRPHNVISLTRLNSYINNNNNYYKFWLFRTSVQLVLVPVHTFNVKDNNLCLSRNKRVLVFWRFGTTTMFAVHKNQQKISQLINIHLHPTRYQIINPSITIDINDTSYFSRGQHHSHVVVDTIVQAHFTWIDPLIVLWFIRYLFY